jgi:two-component system phosphate regulon sensor histidine kinase PhoR
MSVAEEQLKSFSKTLVALLTPGTRTFIIASAAILLVLWLSGALSFAAAVIAFAALSGIVVFRAWLGADSATALSEFRVPASVPAPDLSKTALMDVLPDPIIVLDQSGRVTIANIASIPLVGSAAQGKHVAALLRSAPLIAAIEKVLEGGSACSAEFRQPVPVERHYRAFVAPIISDRTPAGHEQRFVIVVLHDFTDAHRLETMRVDFVANASHELKTPLASLSGFIDTLRGHAKDDEAARTRFLDIMAEQAGRMRRLIENLLSLSRIELREHVRPDTAVDFAVIVRDVVDALAPLAADQGVEMVIQTPAALPHVRGDRDELAQVVQNLVDNALRYAGAGKRIEISLAADMQSHHPMVRLSVRDFGGGIAREHLPRLTERFYRVESSLPQAKGGTGLGLAIVKHIVSRHQGTLHIESEAEKGSVFSVQIPAAESMPSLSLPGNSRDPVA